MVIMKYHSHMVGKWHLGFCDARYTPTKRGFLSHTGYYSGAEDYFVPSSVGDDWGMHGTDFRSGSTQDATTDVPPPYKRPSSISEADCKSPNSTACYSTNVLTDFAVNIINQHDPIKPLFLYLAYQATHNPLSSPDVYRSKYKATIRDYGRQLFAGMMTALDQGVANVTDALKSRNMYDDTVIIFTTDNGGEPSQLGRGNNYPLRAGKVSNLEGGVRGAAFVRGTNSQLRPLPRNETRSNLMHLVDWVPTLFYIATGQNLEDMGRAAVKLDGVNQWQAIAGKVSESPRKFVLHNVQPDHLFNPNLPSDAVRLGDYKLIMRTTGVGKPIPPPGFDVEAVPEPKPYNGSIYFFHIPSDPQETTNLAGQALHEEAFARTLDFYLKMQRKAVPDLFNQWGWPMKEGSPLFRTDKGWGPFNRTNVRFQGHGSNCAYGREYQGDGEPFMMA